MTASVNDVTDVAQLVDSHSDTPVLVANLGTTDADLSPTRSFPSSQTVPLPAGKQIIWPARSILYARSRNPAGGTTATLLTLPGGDGLIPSAADIAAAINLTAADIAAAIGATPLAVDNIAHAIAVAGASAGTPNVGLPSFAVRNVIAASTATAQISGGASALLIPAPAAGRLELHGMSVRMNLTGDGVGGIATAATDIALSVAGTIFWQDAGQKDTAETSTDSLLTDYDFQGVTLPAGEGLRVSAAIGGAFFHLLAAVTVNVNYTTVT